METDIFTKSEMTKNNAKQVFKYGINNHCFAKSSFTIHSIQEAVNLDQDLSDMPHVHDFYLIVWFEEGMGKHVIDFKEYDVQSGTVYFVSPGQVHQFKDMLHYKGYSIVFSEDFLYNMSEMMHKYVKNEIFGSFKSPSFCYTNNKGDLTEDVQRHFSIILDEYENGKQLFGYRDKLGLLLSDLIIFLKRHGTWYNQLEDEKMDNDYHYYLNFIDYVEGHFRQKHEVKEYAKDLNLSVSTLNKSVVKVSGKRPLEIINERIALEAKRILNYSLELKVKQVAGMLGFADVSNFVKFFRQNVGVTPSDFRELD